MKNMTELTELIADIKEAQFALIQLIDMVTEPEPDMYRYFYEIDKALHLCETYAEALVELETENK